GHPKHVRLLLTGDCGLDALGARDHDDSIPLLQQLIEGAVLQIGFRQPGDQGLRDVQHLHRHRFVVRESQALHPHQPSLRRDIEPSRDPGPSGLTGNTLSCRAERRVKHKRDKWSIPLGVGSQEEFLKSLNSSLTSLYIRLPTLHVISPWRAEQKGWEIR